MSGRWCPFATSIVMTWDVIVWPNLRSGGNGSITGRISTRRVSTVSRGLQTVRSLNLIYSGKESAWAIMTTAGLSCRQEKGKEWRNTVRSSGGTRRDRGIFDLPPRAVDRRNDRRPT